MPDMNVIRITDFHAPELDVYARLREVQLLNRHEPEKGIFIAESPRVIERALDAGCVPLSFLSEDKYVEKEAKEILVCIPMAHGVDSLNVAAASAVAFWELGRNSSDKRFR